MNLNQGVKYGQGPLHVRLTYSESSKIIEKSIERELGSTSKRRKTGIFIFVSHVQIVSIIKNALPSIWVPCFLTHKF